MKNFKHTYFPPNLCLKLIFILTNSNKMNYRNEVQVQQLPILACGNWLVLKNVGTLTHSNIWKPDNEIWSLRQSGPINIFPPFPVSLLSIINWHFCYCTHPLCNTTKFHYYRHQYQLRPHCTCQVTMIYFYSKISQRPVENFKIAYKNVTPSFEWQISRPSFAPLKPFIDHDAIGWFLP